MKIAKTKLSGFTILEIIIVMILISVVVAMSYAVFRMVKVYGQKLSLSNQNQNQYLLAKSAFKRDIEGAIYLKMAEDSSLICLTDTSQILYQVKQGLLIRSIAEQTDTMLNVSEIKREYLSENNKNYPYLLKGAIFSIKDSLNKIFYLSAYKTYSSTELFKMPSYAGD
jgi:prepilin-type N-terminal cleavage/methylation domain-containing protein